MKEKFRYVPKEERKKILLICDDVRLNSGVATVAKELVLNTAHHFNWVNLAGAIKHPEKGKVFDISQDVNQLQGIEDSDVKIIPTDGYGNPEIIRHLLKTEKPDAIFLITDPRYFEWLFNIENEIRKQVPIIYLNIWDSPILFPTWNRKFYESCDLLLAISKQTKNINEVVLGSKAKSKLIKYLPHGLNEDIFKPLDTTTDEFKSFKSQVFGDKDKDFVLFFNSRNIRRKQIPDTMLAFRMFLDGLEEEQAKKCALVLHTEIVSEHGTDLNAVKNALFADYPDTIFFSTQKLPAETLNKLYNLADGQILLTSNEGWGLSLTEAILSGTPIIANVQGGMIDQMGFLDDEGKPMEYSKDFPTNHKGKYKTHGKWALPVYPSNISIQGSPMTPFISDDRCRPEDAAEQINKLYNMSPEERKSRGLKGREWALNEAGLTGKMMGEKAITFIDELFDTWKPREQYELINATKYEEEKIEQPIFY